jgi:phosphoenolpyruvate-protein phosphotransferase (PTS system enzyme I)
MRTIQGQGISAGIAIETARYWKRKKIDIKKAAVNDAKTELERFEAARQEACGQLDALRVKAIATIGNENSLLFEIHRMMLEDDDFCDAVTSGIQKEQVSAEYAVKLASEEQEKVFAEMDDPYMKARAADVKDVAMRVLRILTRTENSGFSSDRPYILVSDDLTPSETAQLDRDKIAAIVTSGGTPTSHTAIFARTMGIPAVVGIGDALDESCDGKAMIVDGSTGTVTAEPEPELLSRMKRELEAEKQQRILLEQYRGKPSVTKDGRTVKLCANIGSAADAEAALRADAEGVGLFRSEFLYLESSAPPTEEEQFAAYKAVAEKFGEHPVVIRTLDIGADKQVPYLNTAPEENPALGMRALRLCLTKPDLFRTQLRAIYRASQFGNLAVMFPMVNSLEDVRRAKKAAQEVREELKAQSIPFNSAVELGIMVETPAAAVISDLLAREVDFFSIGTNDLTQYTLAVDRQNAALAPFCDTHHEAVLRLIRLTAENAHKSGIWVGICGELGADETLTETFLNMGIDELSVTPGRILSLRAKVCKSGTPG